MIVMQIKEIKGDCKIPGYIGWITLESFDFGTERKIETLSKGGGQDIETGGGKNDSQEFSVDKSSDCSSVDLMYTSIKHRGSASASTPFTVDVAFIEPRGHDNLAKATIKAYLKIRFGKALLKSWKLNGAANTRPKESLTFWYNQIAMQYDVPLEDGSGYQTFGPKGWDQLDGKDWRPPGW